MVEAQHATQTQETPGELLMDELLTDIRRRVRLPPNVTPDGALRAVMCTLSRHVGSNEACQIFSSLPKEVQPLIERCMRHRSDRLRRFDRVALTSRVAEHLDVSRGDAEDLAAAVLLAVSARLPRVEVVEVAKVLPTDLRHLWSVRRIASPVDPHPILHRIERLARLPRNVSSSRAFGVVIGNLLRRLTGGEARHLFERLPYDLRPLVEECMSRRSEEPDRYGREELLVRVRETLQTDDPERVVRAVLTSLQEYLRTDVFEHVLSQLPSEHHELWAPSESPEWIAQDWGLP